jgi:D-beta-D-heptose 7-phosphate kinase/D-beta-D-heptose 1-phosphate adenosyltransferase
MLLSCLQLVDAVIVFDTETPLSLIQLIEPDVLVKGGDYAMAQIVGAEAVTTKGGRVEIIPILEGFSSTSIIEKMR